MAFAAGLAAAGFFEAAVDFFTAAAAGFLPPRGVARALAFCALAGGAASSSARSSSSSSSASAGASASASVSGSGSGSGA